MKENEGLQIGDSKLLVEHLFIGKSRAISIAPLFFIVVLLCLKQEQFHAL